MNLLVKGSAILADGPALAPPLIAVREVDKVYKSCLLYTSPSPRDS